MNITRPKQNGPQYYQYLGQYSRSPMQFGMYLADLLGTSRCGCVKELLMTLFRVLTVIAAVASAAPVAAVSPLGSATSFAVLGGSAVTNAGPTILNGNVGVFPGTSITGLGSVVLNGSVHLTDSVAQQAHNDAQLASAALAAQSFTVDLSGQDLGGLTLTPRVYKFGTSAQLDGVLTLDYASNSAGSFVFQIGSTLTTIGSSSVIVLNAGPKSGLFFNVGTSAALGVGTVFAGNLIASQSIVFSAGAKILCGRAIALNAALTLDTNAISNDCAGIGGLVSGRTDFGSKGFSGDPANGSVASVVPEPATWTLMILGFVSAGARVRAARHSSSALG